MPELLRIYRQIFSPNPYSIAKWSDKLYRTKNGHKTAETGNTAGTDTKRQTILTAKGGMPVEDAVTLLAPLTRNIEIFRSRLFAPDNADVLIRRFRSGAFESAVIAIDGMVSSQTINENILKPCMDLPRGAGADIPPEERAGWLMLGAVSVLPVRMKDNIDEILSDVLGGQCALLCDGCTTACVMDVRGFEKRTIGKPETEHVVLGPHESFTESIRTNITLLRRIVQRAELTTEFISAGGEMKTRCALLYLRGTADENMLERIRCRLMDCQSSFPLTIGDVEQIIESHPLSLIPQCVRTERPDRAASFIAEGQIVILTDGSAEVLGAPATIYHQLHTPDDASMRWQYGTFLRIIRLIGILIHLFLPGFYLAVLRFHPELLSAMLLTSVYETSSRVPLPVFLEALLMTLAFDLITEAGLRAPGALGSALGIVSGLILGQSAVSADIVSPLLLIVVAASGLGGFCVPSYSLSVGLKIVQLMIMTAGALGGLYGIALLSLSLLCLLCAMTSIGSPLAAPVAPSRHRNPDILLRLPLRLQKAAAFFSLKQGTQTKQDVHRARLRSSFRARACAAGLCAGAQVLLLGTGAAMPFSLNAAWIAALAAPPAAALAAVLCRKRLVQSLSGMCPSRAGSLCAALSLLICAVFSVSGLLNLCEQTFLSQARQLFILLLTLGFLLLCAPGGVCGAARAAFSLRWALPTAALAVLLRPVLHGETGGIFPLLGAGTPMLGLSALLMLGAAAPVVLLMLPPKQLGSILPEDVPPAGFFAGRAFAGALVGVLVLLGMTLGTTHETLSGYRAWGERLRLFGADGGRAGLFVSLLTVLECVLLFLHAAITLFSAANALSLTGVKKKGLSLTLCVLSASAALFALLYFGFDPILAAGALAILPAGLALIRRPHE